MTSQKVSEKEEKTTSQEIKITGTLITVVIMFLVCQLPTAATLIYEIFHVKKLTPNEEAVLRALGNIFNFLVSLNAACNFILYCALSDKYRRTFTSTFCRFFHRRSRKVHLKALFARQMDEEPNNQVRLVNNTSLSSKKLASKLHWMHTDTNIPSSTRRNKVNCYVIALPVISGTNKAK